ncbi:MAG: hypothetical protein LIO94_11430 [Clostridiales bacterium]|nr:hypothetical protein [Clostridiales bacterium]
MKEQKILRCNGCGRMIRKEKELYQEDVFFAEQDWGYFSEKDGEHHSFCLCENCYDKIIRTFAIPVKIEER